MILVHCILNEQKCFAILDRTTGNIISFGRPGRNLFNSIADFRHACAQIGTEPGIEERRIFNQLMANGELDKWEKDHKTSPATYLHWVGWFILLFALILAFVLLAFL